MVPNIPPKYRPRGISFLYEDRDVIVVSKEAGILTTHTRRHEPFTVENAVGNYLRKGCARSTKRAYLVHRLDRETSGLLLFAKNEEAQERIKDHWKENEKIYFALVRGTPSPESGVLESYLAENEDLYMVTVRDPSRGKFCQTGYEVLAGAGGVSAVRMQAIPFWAMKNTGATQGNAASTFMRHISRSPTRSRGSAWRLNRPCPASSPSAWGNAT